MRFMSYNTNHNSAAAYWIGVPSQLPQDGTDIEGNPVYNVETRPLRAGDAKLVLEWWTYNRLWPMRGPGRRSEFIAMLDGILLEGDEDSGTRDALIAAFDARADQWDAMRPSR